MERYIIIFDDDGKKAFGVNSESDDEEKKEQKRVKLGTNGVKALFYFYAFFIDLGWSVI